MAWRGTGTLTGVALGLRELRAQPRWAAGVSGTALWLTLKSGFSRWTPGGTGTQVGRAATKSRCKRNDIWRLPRTATVCNSEGPRGRVYRLCHAGTSARRKGGRQQWAVPDSASVGGRLGGRADTRRRNEQDMREERNPVRPWLLAWRTGVRKASRGTLPSPSRGTYTPSSSAIVHPPGRPTGRRLTETTPVGSGPSRPRGRLWLQEHRRLTIRESCPQK